MELHASKIDAERLEDADSEIESCGDEPFHRQKEALNLGDFQYHRDLCIQRRVLPPVTLGRGRQTLEHCSSCSFLFAQNPPLS